MILYSLGIVTVIVIGGADIVNIDIIANILNWLLIQNINFYQVELFFQI